VDGAVRAISGLSQAFDLATSASTTSVAGQLENGISALGRVLENTRPGAAGVWTCLDETSPGGHAAVTATKQGDALLVRRANGSEWLMTLTY
jgi:hypothetical protein